MLSRLRTYVLENEFKITILKNKVDIVNYTDIGHFDDTKIVVKYSEGTATVKGNNLTIAKMLNDELLILGNIETLEFT